MKRMIAILLLLTLSLSMWGCSSSPTSTTKPSQQPNRPNSSASNQRPNNNNSSNNNSSTKIDPNGFSTMEQLVGAYVAFQYTGTASETQVRKLWPEKYFEKNYGSFETAYSKYLTNASATRESLKSVYGADYTFSYQILSSEIRVDMSNESISESEEQEHINLYGVSLKKRCQYTVTVSITIKGSKVTKNKQIEINCAKVGNKWYGW